MIEHSRIYILIMHEESSEPFQYVQKIAEIFGIWSVKYSFKYYVCSIISTVFYMLMNGSSFFGLYREVKRGKLEEICSNTALLLIGIFASTTIMLQRRKKSRYMIADLFKKEILLNNHPNQKMREIYRATIKEIWPGILFKIMRWLIYAAVVVFSVAMVIHILDNEKDVDGCIENPKCSLIFMNYYHLPWDERRFYWASNIQNVLFGGICGIFSCCRDVYISIFIIYLRCKLRMLSYVFGHMDEFINTYNSKNYDCLLKECIKEHQNITSEFICLRKKYFTVFLLMLVVHTPVLINTAIIMFQGAEINSFTIFIYFAAMYGSHIFLFLWLSEQLSFESTQLAESIYFSNWYEMELHQQKLMQIMLISTRRPFSLSCGSFFPASLNTFAKTMKVVYTIVNGFINFRSHINRDG